MELTATFTVITSLLYLFSAGLVIFKLFDTDGPNLKWVYLSAFSSISIHAILLANQVVTDVGQNLSLINVASLACLLIVIASTLGSLKARSTLLLPAVYSFASLLIFTTLFFPKNIMVMQLAGNMVLIGHIALSFLAYCVLVIATLYAVQYQYINHKLKSRDVRIAYSHLPPLMQVEQQQFKLLVMGTLLLTTALATGFWFLHDMFAKEIAHKTVLSLVAWAVFVTVIWGHKFGGWRGRSTVTGTVVGAAILTLAYFGSRFIREVVIG
ncbi:cytochrome C assembly family protein [Flocculibacter collagenilyticus]|uniref:cytochrome C assembly family protein n=1 Tax=Flocculibacter collagenilyticus TaxID=2744479 RepID=UPI0018F691E3|nr:cytochrome c biogenesis protein CcsA [Flocculibacter collagenilyticus]